MPCASLLLTGVAITLSVSNLILFHKKILFVTSSFVGGLIGQILFMKRFGFVLVWLRQNYSITLFRPKLILSEPKHIVKTPRIILYIPKLILQKSEIILSKLVRIFFTR